MRLTASNQLMKAKKNILHVHDNINCWVALDFEEQYQMRHVIAVITQLYNKLKEPILK